jgi:hypothetical protein
MDDRKTSVNTNDYSFVTVIYTFRKDRYFGIPLHPKKHLRRMKASPTKEG